MMVIAYAGTELLTGDDIAVGVLRYCEALAGSVVAEVIEIPVLEPDGSLSVATLLVGPSSQMFARRVKSDFAEVVDLDVMRRLAERTRAQHLTAESVVIAGDGDARTAGVRSWETEYDSGGGNFPFAER